MAWRFGLSLMLLLNLVVCSFAAEPDLEKTYDVVVYGGTSGGVIAAVQTVKLGKSVLLLEPGEHLGGLSSGGLGATDIGNKQVIGGLSRQFYRDLYTYYEQPDVWKQEKRESYVANQKFNEDKSMWKFEPHVAELIFDRYLAENKIPLLRQARLDLKNGVKKDGNRITSIALEGGRTVKGRMFIDATYEGDLMAKAGVEYHVGREANSVYNETLNGVQVKNAVSHQFTKPVSAYKEPGNPASGLLPGVIADKPLPDGSGDKRVQAYNFRLCLTPDASNQLPFPKPEGYDPLRYELYLRYMQAGGGNGMQLNNMMPNKKTDTNNTGAFSSDNIGMNYDYPEADYATRDKIFKEHVTYHQGLLWFLANDPRVPEKQQAQIKKWGLAKDEFQKTGGWPHQMYVREARRMIGPVVMTQHHCQKREVAKDSVGMGAYNMDSHNVQRYVDANGNARNEGDIQVGVRPYAISYQSIVPKEDQCANLLVPVCLSASHIAYGSIRMEPVFMVLGQSSATAACFALDDKVTLQKLDYAKLREKLLADGQVLEYEGGRKPGEAAALDPAKLSGIVIDNDKAEFTGEWGRSSSTGGYVGVDYQHSGGPGGEKTATYTIPVKEAKTYQLRLAYTPFANRATNVPVTVKYESPEGPQTKTVSVNQRKPTKNGFADLLELKLKGDSKVIVILETKETDGHVIADAVQLE